MKKKEKTKPQMPKEVQWDEVPPPLSEYLGKNRKRNRNKQMSFLKIIKICKNSNNNQSPINFHTLPSHQNMEQLSMDYYIKNS